MPVRKPGVTTIAKAGSTALRGDVTLTGGSNVTLTQSGQDISIAASGGGGGGGTVFPASIQGRLTTEPSVPISTADRTAQGAIYFTPSLGGVASTNGYISLYNGSALVDVAFTQLSLTLTGLTSGKNYDVFVDYNGGTPQLVLSAAWTNDTTRADAIGVQSGIVVKSGTPAYRWVGTIRTTGTTTTEDSEAKRFVWNAFNQVPRKLKKHETTSSWSYSTATWRPLNNNTNNRVEWVNGLNGAMVEVDAYAMVEVDASGSGEIAHIGIDLDGTSANDADTAARFGMYSGAGATQMLIRTTLRTNPGLGYHFAQAMEWVDTASVSYYANGVNWQSGLDGMLWN